MAEEFSDSETDISDVSSIITDEVEDIKEIKYRYENKITKPFLTIYEMTLLIGKRATQIANGAQPLIKMSEIELKNLSAEEIAKLEFKYKLIPFLVVRLLPNGVKEVWRLSEFQYLINIK